MEILTYGNTAICEYCPSVIVVLWRKHKTYCVNCINCESGNINFNVINFNVIRGTLTYIESFSFASDIGSQKLELCIWTYFELFGYRPDTEIGALFVILLRSQNYGSQ